jgi:methylenetetrahydrofolate dehydrogenase (NADP+)/methenyltetrahydrofolate cyclohydrolase
MLLLDGKKARDYYREKMKERLGKLGFSPCLAIIQIGKNAESSIYIEQKKKFAASLGIQVKHIELGELDTESAILKNINELNKLNAIHGIIVQLPIPAHLNKLTVINAIDPSKDVDGLTDTNQKLLEDKKPKFIPATAKGVLLLLNYYSINVHGKKVAVFGRSRLVGHPVAKLLEIEGAQVSVCHSKTINAQKISKESDIVIVAIGKPKLINSQYVKNGAVVIDVGINSVKGTVFEEEIPGRKVIGDVDYNDVKALVSAISPVPGGVGPMTVLSLFDNVISSAESTL